MRLSKLTEVLSMMAATSVALCGASFAQVCPPVTPKTNFTFFMVPTLGSESCVAHPTGRVTITHTAQLVENMHVEMTGLPKNTDFDLFVIQKPAPNFGLSWYMGDMLTDATGAAVADFIGRFNIGTFIVAPGSEPAPVVPLPLGAYQDANSNPLTKAVQLFHLGLWFDSPVDANSAGCGSKVTPFNSTHNAGVKAMNTSNFPDLAGPLCTVAR
jgi:hypothetical protein